MSNIQESKIYEVPIWFRVDTGAAGAEEEVLTLIRQKLSGLGAEIVSETKAIRRRIAYPIFKAREGVFVVFDVALNPERAHQVREAFRHDSSVLRVGLLQKAMQKDGYSVDRNEQDNSVPGALIQEPEHQQVKAIPMEELDKKLEEILHGDDTK